MKVSKQDAIALFMAIKITDCEEWPDKRLAKKLNELDKYTDLEELESLEGNVRDLGVSILEAREHGKKIVLAMEEVEEEVEEEEKEEMEEEEVQKPKKKKESKMSKKTEDKKADKKKTAPKASKAGAGKTSTKKKGKPVVNRAGRDGKPGVIGSIVEFLQGASKTKPISKTTIVEKLAKRFPDRDPDSMSKTVNIQVPTRIRAEKKLKVTKVQMKSGGSGYYVA